MKMLEHIRMSEYVHIYDSVYFWFMSWIRYQFYRKKLGIIPSIKEGSRGLSKASALSVPVKVVLKRSVFRAQETSQELCTSASQVPPSSVGIYCIKRGALIRWINKAIPSNVPSSHENEGGTAVMELSEFHPLKKSHWCWILTMHSWKTDSFYFISNWKRFSNLIRKSPEKDILEYLPFCQNI